MDPRSLPDTIKTAVMDARHTMNKISDVADNLRGPITEIKDTTQAIHNHLPSVVRAVDSFRETNEHIVSIARTVNKFTKPMLILITVAILLLIVCGLWYLTGQFSKWWASRTSGHSTASGYRAESHHPASLSPSSPSYMHYERDSGNSLAAALLSSSSANTSHSIDVQYS